ncbi:MAG: right-handed parallel beta-helix repeat-containing protein, partial [Pseudomonadota bacterium]
MRGRRALLAIAGLLAAVLGEAAVVNSTGDAGDSNPGNGVCSTGATNSQGATECTLRAAIQETNATADDTIDFNMPTSEAGHSGGVWTIAVGGPLPAFSDTVNVDGASQPGFAGTPIVEVDGTAATGLQDFGLWLNVGSDGSTINALSVVAFGGAGLQLEGSDNHSITGNYIGLRADGVTGDGNRFGIYITGSSDSVIGGTAAAERNVISANSSNGIAVFRDLGLSLSSFDTIITGNYVGTDASGLLPRGNGSSGIFVVNGSSRTRVGGTTASEANVVAANGDSGVFVGSGGIVDAQVVGNLIGLGADGTTQLANSQSGVELSFGDRTTVRGNTIGPHGLHGVHISGSDESVVIGNVIGTNGSGTATWSIAGHGVFLEASSARNRIGGTVPSEANVISNAGSGGTFTDGVALSSSAANDNSILRNRIFGNAGLGIELNGDGISLNDPGDADGGPNERMNYPVITNVSSGGGNLTVDYDLNLPSGAYRVEFFTNPSGADPSGNGEGELFAGADIVSHPGSGAISYSHVIPGGGGDVVTATTTECTNGLTCTAFGSTSEFSQAFGVASISDLTLALTDSPDPAPANGPLLYTLLVTNDGPDTATAVTLTDNLPAGVTLVSA